MIKIKTQDNQINKPQKQKTKKKSCGYFYNSTQFNYTTYYSN